MVTVEPASAFQAIVALAYVKPAKLLLDREANTCCRQVREVLCEPTRTQIVRVLSSGPLTVSELAAILNRSKSATSQHLRVLRDGGVVTNRRRGRSVIYSLVAHADGRCCRAGARSRREQRSRRLI